MNKGIVERSTHGTIRHVSSEYFIIFGKHLLLLMYLFLSNNHLSYDFHFNSQSYSSFHTGKANLVGQYWKSHLLKSTRDLQSNILLLTLSLLKPIKRRLSDHQ